MSSKKSGGSSSKSSSSSKSGPSQSAITGKFVSPAYAAKHPNTTFTNGPKKR